MPLNDNDMLLIGILIDQKLKEFGDELGSWENDTRQVVLKAKDEIIADLKAAGGGTAPTSFKFTGEANAV